MAKGNLIGGWAFLVGVVLAIVLGAIQKELSSTMAIIIIVLGAIVGFLNIADEEATPFLMSGTALVIVASLGKDVTTVIAWFGRILDALLMLFVPATIIVAIKNVFGLAHD